jgi:hypothetical protein
MRLRDCYISYNRRVVANVKFVDGRLSGGSCAGGEVAWWGSLGGVRGAVAGQQQGVR